jgi:DNA-binding transcriptional MerR regulator
MFEMDKVRSRFSTSEVSKLTSLTVRQIQNWDKVGFIRPSETKEVGGKRVRVYEFGDLIAIRAAQRLLKAGLSLQKVRYAVSVLQNQLQQFKPDITTSDILKKCVFVTDGERLFELVTNPPQLIDVITGQSAFFYAVRIDELADNLISEIRSLEDVQKKFSNISGKEEAVS